MKLITALPCVGLVSTLVTIVGVIGHAEAQAAFHQLQGGQINKVVFIDSNKGWTVEDGGRIRYTTDGGVTWTFATVPVGIRADLYDIFFTDPSDPASGWVAGDQGIVLKATALQSGTVWEEATLSTHRVTDALVTAQSTCGQHPAKLQGIFMSSSSHGWVVGYDGAIAYTNNGWTDWTRPTSGLPTQWDCSDAAQGPDDIYDIHFFKDPSASTHYLNGIACGDDRAYYTTANGGTTWTWHAIPDYTCPNEHYIELWRMSFADPENPASAGWMVGGFGTSAGYVFSTSNGGQTWSQETCYDVLDPSLEAGHNCDFSTMYDVANLGASGQPWGLTAGYDGQAFVRENTGGSITGNFEACASPCSTTCSSGTAIWVEKDTTNFGENLCDQKPPFKGVARISDTRGCAVGMFGRIITFESGGGNEIVDRGTTYFNRLADGVFTNSSAGWVIGEKDQIYQTDDGGDSWRNISNWSCGGPSAYGTGIDISPSGSNGIAVGVGGFVAHGTNYALDWTQLTTTTSPPGIPSGLPDLNAAAFVPGTGSVTAYAVGSAGCVIKSTDSGAHWATVTATGSDALKGLSFIDTTHGYVVGDHGKVFATDDGGSSWTAISVQGTPSRNFNDVATWGTWGTNRAPAMIVGDAGVIYEKGASDRGFSAVSTGLGQTADLYDVEALSSGTYVRIGGDLGVALFRDSGTWTLPNSQTTFPIHKMAFQSATSGKAIGVNFIVLDYH